MIWALASILSCALITMMKKLLIMLSQICWSWFCTCSNLNNILMLLYLILVDFTKCMPLIAIWYTSNFRSNMPKTQNLEAIQNYFLCFLYFIFINLNILDVTESNYILV